MIDVNALRAEWVKNGLCQKDVAQMIGISAKTLSLKLKKGILGSDEIDILIDELNISDPMQIFLSIKQLIKLLNRGRTPTKLKE